MILWYIRYSDLSRVFLNFGMLSNEADAFSRSPQLRAFLSKTWQDNWRHNSSGRRTSTASSHQTRRRRVSSQTAKHRFFFFVLYFLWARISIMVSWHLILIRTWTFHGVPRGFVANTLHRPRNSREGFWCWASNDQEEVGHQPCN